MCYFDIHSHATLCNNTVVSFTAKEFLLQKEKPKFATVGIHPWQQEVKEKQFNIIEKAALQNEIIAVGECGIDRIKGGLSIKQQRKNFERQIEIAEHFSLPIIIHSVRAHSDIFSIRKRYKKTIWLMHGFIGNEQEIQNCLRHNLRISPGLALLLYNHNNIFHHRLYHLLKKIPLDFLYLETDGVNITIKEIYTLVAQKLELPLQQLSNQIKNNFNRDFLS